MIKNWPAMQGTFCNTKTQFQSLPGSGRSPGEGNGHPLQYSCLGNPMNRGTWRAIVHGVTKIQTWLSNLTFSLSLFPSTGFMLSYCHCQFSRQWHLHKLLNYSTIFFVWLGFSKIKLGFKTLNQRKKWFLRKDAMKNLWLTKYVFKNLK